jgi:hypothetical protein
LIFWHIQISLFCCFTTFELAGSPSWILFFLLRLHIRPLRTACARISQPLTMTMSSSANGGVTCRCRALSSTTLEALTPIAVCNLHCSSHITHNVWPTNTGTHQKGH